MFFFCVPLENYSRKLPIASKSNSDSFQFFLYAIFKTVKTIAEPIIKDRIPKYKIDAVEFDSFSLGNLPPTFHGSTKYSTIIVTINQILWQLIYIFLWSFRNEGLYSR